MRLGAKGEQKQGPREGREEGADGRESHRHHRIIPRSSAKEMPSGVRSFLFGGLMGGTRVGAANIVLSFSFFPRLWSHFVHIVPFCR